MELRAQGSRPKTLADLENFGGGDNKNFKHTTSKIRMSLPKLKVIFRPKSEIQTFFPPKIRWSPKKKKKVFTEIESDFSAEIVTFRLVGGDASPPILPLNPPLAKDSLFEDRPFLGQGHRRKCSPKKIIIIRSAIFFVQVFSKKQNQTISKKTSFSTKSDLQTF